jgi:hypothetical protein
MGYDNGGKYVPRDELESGTLGRSWLGSCGVFNLFGFFNQVPQATNQHTSQQHATDIIAQQVTRKTGDLLVTAPSPFAFACHPCSL